jgi:hydrogenase maturation protein HypF
MREPWRNTYAHLQAALGWGNDQAPFAELELTAFLERQPLATLAAMLDRGINSPPASSCGRLFDAVAAAVGLCRERISFEGEAAQALEAIVDESTLYHEADSQAYTCTIMRLANNDLLYLEPKPLWQALLQDLAASTPAGVIAARFHKGLARAITAMAVKLCPSRENRVVALSGGVMQNKVLFEQLDARLQAQGFTVLSHHQVPAGDGGLALGQALIAAAQRSEFVSKMPSWHF